MAVKGTEMKVEVEKFASFTPFKALGEWLFGLKIQHGLANKNQLGELNIQKTFREFQG